MTEQVFAVNGNSGGLRTEINQRTSASLLRVGEHTVGQCEGRDKYVGNGNTRSGETLLEVAIVVATPKDIEEMTF